MGSPRNLNHAVASVPELLAIVNRFKQAWERTSGKLPPPDLGAHLPHVGHPVRPLALLELVRLDLEMRWRRGQRTELEFYAEQFLELGEPANLPVELIYHEYHVRRQHGDRPSLSVYRQRFPAQLARLKAYIQSQEAGPSSAADSPSTARRPPAPSTEKSPSPSQWDTLPQNGVASPSTIGKADKAPGASTQVPPHGPGSGVVPVVGGYRLLKLMGKGANGAVWRSQAPGGVEVAVKHFFRPFPTEEVQGDLRALDHVKQLRHGHLVQIHAIWVHRGQLYVAMDLADESLLARAERYRKQDPPGIPPDELLRYMEETAQALDFLHSQNVHHRDIKPANILLLRGQVKVADFDLARPLGTGQTVGNATIGGTPAYMAPEVWDYKISRHSDQWSLAATYFELRLGRSLFKSDKMSPLREEICKGRYDLSALEPDERRVLRRSLERNPRDRYPSCTAFVEALRDAFKTAPPPPEGRRLTVLVTFLACLLLGGLLLFFWLRPGPVREPFVPAGFEPVDRQEIVTDVRGVPYYKSIRRLDEGCPIELLLVPQETSGEDTKTFYISRDKITRGQFNAFRQQSPGDRDRVHEERWKTHADDDQMPIRDVTWREADAFARWVGGRLPLLEQWDKAAGLNHPSRGEGPYRGKWDGHLKVAVNRDRPARVGDSEDDQSPYGCRDMAGNGYEWTRSFYNGRQTPPDRPGGKPEGLVHWRGQTFRMPRPLTFDDLAGPGVGGNFDEPDSATGFRVVLEPGE